MIRSVYRVVGPLVLLYCTVWVAVERGWMENPMSGPLYTLIVMGLFAVGIFSPLLALFALVGSVRLVRDVPFVVPLWIFTLALLLIIGPAAAAMLGIHIPLNDSAAEYFGVPCVVAGVLATYEGYRPPRPGHA